MHIIASITNIVGNALNGALTVFPSAFAPADRRDGTEQQATLAQDAGARAVSEPRSTPSLPDVSDRAVQQANEQAVTEAQVTRRTTAIALADRAFGEAVAIREMRARTLDLPAAVAAEVVSASRPTLESIVASTFGPAHTSGAARDQIATELVRIIEHLGRDRRGEVLAGETAALILDALARSGDEYRLSTFALGIRFGTGLVLPLAIADELGRRGDRRRRRLLLLAMEQGLRQLGERIAAGVGALIELTRPLADVLASEPDCDAGKPGDEGEPVHARRLLQQHTAANPTLPAVFGSALRHVDVVGHDAFFALDALAKRSESPVELQSSRADLLASQATAFSIGQSAAAHDAAFHVINTDAPNHPERLPAVTLERADRTYRALGFAPSRSALLARAAVAWDSAACLDTRWVALEWSGDLPHQGRLFEALLHFIAMAPTERRLRAVNLLEIDDDVATRPLWGLPLFHALEEPLDEPAPSQRIDSMPLTWR
jgi:hypothetical protein